MTLLAALWLVYEAFLVDLLAIVIGGAPLARPAIPTSKNNPTFRIFNRHSLSVASSASAFLPLERAFQ
jgi:hypothetical protein